MSATIKISKKTKSQIENLQARLILANGKKVSQMDLIERVFEKVIERPDVLDIFMDRGNDAALIDAWLKKTRDAPDWGVSNSSEDIDSQIAGK
jgi:hypothetical protein